MAGKSHHDSLLVTAAKAIGTAAGKLAHAAGVEGEPKRRAKRKLPKKHKSRLPRRQKKAQKKTAQKKRA